MYHAWKTRVISLLLVVAMVVGLVPMSVFATETEGMTGVETAVVHFDVNGGVGTYEDQEVSLGGNVQKPEADPTREAWVFAHWTADTEANDPWIFEENTVDGDMTLYAVWTESVAPASEEEEVETTADNGGEIKTAGYTVLHRYMNLDGETYQEETVTVENAVVGEMTAAEAVARVGFANREITQTTVSEEGTVVEIYYDRLTYTAVFMDGETEFAKVENIPYGSVLENPGAPKAEGAVFAGWICNEAAWDFASGTVAADLTLTASWETVEEPEKEEFTSVLNNGAFVSQTHDRFSSVSSTIAPGITQSINYAYAKDGKQMVYYVATADISRDDVIVQTSYKDQYINKAFGMEKLTNQMAFADKLYTDETSDRFVSEYYKAVVGVNASFYNMTTGQPSGVTYLDGVQIGESASYNQFFAILKDGSAIIDYTSNLKKYEGNIQQAAAGSQMLVWEGEDVTMGINGSYNTDRHSRTCVGVTADGKVVLMVLDGRQEPFSCGGTMHELAQIMLEAGCVAAINLDGGGSTTYAARQEGQENVTIVNRPSDGSERSISSGIIVGSMAVPSNVFERATLTPEYTYVTPGSSVAVQAVGISPAGTSAEIPENAQWQVSDEKMGTIADGLFTAAEGFAGDAVVQMTVDGAVVGAATIHVVVPDKLVFNSAEITIPYGKTATLELTATYGLNVVALKEGDVVFALETPAAGTVNGFAFTGTDDLSVSGTKVAAKLAFAEEITAEAQLNLGKGSEVIFDFEDGETGGLVFSEKTHDYNYVWPLSSQEIVTAANGRVHSGSYAMKASVNYSNSMESGYQKTSLLAGPAALFENAVRVGMWIYIPEEAVGLWARWTLTGYTGFDENGAPTGAAGINGNAIDTTAGGTGSTIQFDESGWHYLHVDTSAYKAVGWAEGGVIMQFYISDRDGSAYGYDASDYSNIPGDFHFYIDDITVDYSSAVDDREAPVFASVRYSDEAMSDAVELNNQITASNVLSFGAVVHEDTTKSNYTGLDESTAKAYIDGVEVGCTISGGIMSISGRKLTNGVHTVKFSICDKMGNYSSEIRKITVAAKQSESTIKLVPHDATLDRIPFDSVYYMDLVATAIEEVKSAQVTIDLDSLSTWSLSHMEVAEGFSASYQVDTDENHAYIRFTRTENTDASGEAVLASIPVRVWSLVSGYKYENGTKKGQNAFTMQQFISMKEFWRISVIADLERGVLSRMDGSSSTFSGDRVFADTEAWAEDADMLAKNSAYHASWKAHTHTAEALADKAATCTETGYIGRTFCAGCNSPVEWGTTIPANGHSYALVDGVRKCTVEACGKLFNGVYEGITYVDGVALAGWVGDAYYVDGQKLTGIQKVSAPDASDEFYYDFGEDGTSKGKYTGLFLDESVEAYRYSKLGVLTAGWVMIDNDWYYFLPETMVAAKGELSIEYVKYVFEETGKLTSGVWIHNSKGTKYSYGPAQYYTGWQEIDGETYYFEKAYILKGYRYVVESNSKVQKWFDFGEDGALVGELDYTGLLVTEIGTYYLKNGISQQGLFYADGYYYYFPSATLSACKNGTYHIANNNGLSLPVGSYVFDEEGRIILRNGIIEEDGTLYYYVNDARKHAGLIQIDGEYYYVKTGGIVVTGRYYVSNTNDLLPAGYYEFAADGKMKNGIVAEDGALYYYVNGARASGGLMQIDGAYYYVRSNCQVAVGSYYINNTNGLLPQGTYEFAADGKMMDGFVEIDGERYYFVNGVKTAAGMIIVDGDYYYVRTGGKLATGKYYCNSTNDLLPKGYYEFAADGKMKNGIVAEDGALYYYVNGARASGGLMQIDGAYYYVRSNCQVAVGSYYINNTNGLLPQGTYEFAADGKMKQGIVSEADGLYYYVNGVKTKAGMIRIGEDYYYVRTGGKLATGYYYCNSTNDLMPSGFYTFGADGKLVK